VSNHPLRQRLAQIGIIALIALAGCSDGRQPGDVVGTTETACPSFDSPPDNAEPRPAASAPAGPLAPVPFGRSNSTVGAGFDVEFAVLGYKQPAGSACPDPDHAEHEWAAVDARACAKALPAGFDFVVAWAPWAFAFADGTVVREASVNFPGFEEPRYPGHKVLPVGECVRGWITMSVPKGERPVTVLYWPVTEVHAWTVPPPS
jgi:hypothetical protein